MTMRKTGSELFKTSSPLHYQGRLFPDPPSELHQVYDSQVIPAMGNRQIHVVHLATRLIFAGMGHVVASLTRELPIHQYLSAIWCIEEADALGLELQSEGYEVVELKKRRRRDFALFLRIAALIRRKQIDILHCHDDLSWFYGTIGARLGGRPQILVTMHGRRPDFSRRHLWEQRLLASLTTNVICVSSYLRQQIITEIGASPNKVVVVHNGIPLKSGKSGQEQRQQARTILGIPDDAIVAGSVGRLAKVKNLDLLLEAVVKALPLVPMLRVVLIGEGPCRDHLAQRAAALGLNEVVSFTGLRKDVSQLLPGFDMYVCSSDYEGVSLSILEAMAEARAVIATAVGGNPEIVQHNETGILVERGDSYALAQAIIKLSCDVATRSQLGQQAKAIVEKSYSSDQMVRSYNVLYQTALRLLG